MSEELDKKAALERFMEVATLAGINGAVDGDGDWAGDFNFNDGRSQMVYATPINTPEGPGVCVYSPATDHKRGMFGTISGKAAIELLQRNENLAFARYGIRRYKQADVVVASVDFLLETLDPKELRCGVWLTAAAADRWEKETTGKDQY